MLALKVPFNYKQLNDIQSTKKVDPVYISNKIPKHFSKEIKNLCIDLLKAYPAERPDINIILTKYRIIKNEINEIQKMFGENFLIKNMYKTELNHKNEDKNKNVNNNYKTRFQSICTNYIKIGDDRKKKASSKKKFNLPKKKEEFLGVSVYENIKEKIKDPHNIMERGYEQNSITGEIISIPDNAESIDFNNNKQSIKIDMKINDSNKNDNKEIINEK